MAVKATLKIRPISQNTAVKHWFSKKTDVLVPFLIFLWPFLYLFRDILPIRGKYVAIAQDFYPLYYKYKVYLLAGMAEGHLPLWSPSEGAGYPFFSNPFAQVFYPLNLLLFPYYKIFHTYTPFDHQIYTILGLGIFALGLFLWLRLIIPNIRAVLFGVLILSVSFKVTEILRFPNAVHAAAWYPWILYAITRLFYSTSIKKSLIISGLLFFSIICLCTAGYPYYLYYSIFLFPPYLCIFLFRPVRLQLLGPKKVQWKHGIFSLAISGMLAGLITAPYLVAIQKLMSVTVDRGGKNFAYSTAHVFNIKDTIGSLIYPPFAQTEGWYFFSITGLLVILLLPCLLYRHIAENIQPSAIPQPSVKEQYRWTGIMFLLFWICVISYITHGKSSWLFTLLWDHLPAFSSLRVWGRFNIILVPLIAWLLSIAYTFFESLLFKSDRTHPDKARKDRIWAISFVTGIYLIILTGQIFLYLNNLVDPYWNFSQHLFTWRIQFILTGLIGYSAIIAAILFTAKFPKHLLSWSLPVLLAAIAVLEMWPVGAHTWAVKTNYPPKQEYFDLKSTNIQSFMYPRKDDWDTISLLPVFNVGLVDNWYFNRYINFRKNNQMQSTDCNILLGIINGQKVFFSESIVHNTIQSFLRDSVRFSHPGRLVSYDGDTLVWDIETPVAGYLSFIDNWDSSWKAYVDNKDIPIELLFGTFKSIPLTQGKHRVIFRYEPTLKTVIFGTM
jgi:hypothetical protein